MRSQSEQESSGRALQITPWERQALQLLADGDTTIDVAIGLGMSTLEAETLLTRLFAAMGAATQVEAIAAAHKRGLLLVPKRTQRIRPCRAPGGDNGRDDHAAEDDRQRSRERDAVGRADAEQHASKQPADAECRDNTESGANRTEPQASCENSANDRQA
jgi:DNA-binding CsgD family transcriptional regulator